MCLAAHAIERGRIKIHKGIHDYVRSDYGLDQDEEEEPEEKLAGSKAYTNKKCALEKLVDRAGHETVTFISVVGSKTTLIDRSRHVIKNGIGPNYPLLEAPIILAHPPTTVPSPRPSTPPTRSHPTRGEANPLPPSPSTRI